MVGWSPHRFTFPTANYERPDIMSFVVTSPAPDQTEAEIASNAFFPSVPPANIRASHRIDNTVTAERLRDVLIESIASVNQELHIWRINQETAGKATLAAVEANEVDGVSINVHRYLRAVGCMAKALLIERYADFDATGKHAKTEAQMEDPIDDLRRDARWAISDIIGIGRTTVELI